MISKLDRAKGPDRKLTGHSRLIRSTFALASRAMTFWIPKHGTRRTKDWATPPSGPELETIEEILSNLQGKHCTFKDVTSRYGNIDYVILSQDRGVFLLETKPHSGRVSVVDCKLRVNGKLPEKDFVAAALRNTYWLIEEIRNVTAMETLVTPLIVFTNASVETGRSLKGIQFANRETLRATIHRDGEPIPAQIWEKREQLAAMLNGKPVAAAGEPAPGVP
jgi:hypothetical protein